MRRIIFILLSSALFAVSACSKEDTTSSNPNPGPNPTVTKKQLISGKTWKQTAGTDYSGFDYFSQIDACKRDDVFTYDSTSMKVTWDEGATKCDPSHPQTVNVWPWKFSIDEKKLIRNNIDTAYIQELTATKMVLIRGDSSVPIIYVETYTAQ